MNCRHCQSKLTLSFVDLGTAPPSNSYLNKKQLNSAEAWYPLHVLICKQCWLVQTEDYNDANELFTDDYAYFSSFSSSWLEHSRLYATAMLERFALDEKSLVIEVAANDGYLLQYFQKLNIKCLGIEPTMSTAMAAEAKGLNIIHEFFSLSLAEDLLKKNQSADLMIANNVLAHVPDINDFTQGFTKILKFQGVATFEFPHVLTLVEKLLFDTIYHEHYSYLSLRSVIQIFEKSGLQVFDVEEYPTQGGSLRVFAQRKDTGQFKLNDSVARVLAKEEKAGLFKEETYINFQKLVEKSKNNFLKFLLTAKDEGKTVGAYGAAAKGNTLINFAGIRSDLIPWIADRNPDKQNKYIPGGRIPIVNEDFLKKAKPDYVILIPWNLKNELVSQLSYVREWGGQFVVAQPHLEIF